MLSITFDTGSVECVNITTIDDEALEGDHDFSISLTSSSLEDSVVLSAQSVTAVINDNESKFSFSESVSCISATFLYIIRTTSSSVQMPQLALSHSLMRSVRMVDQ